MKNQEAILKIAGGAIIAALTVIIYHNALYYGFVSDDGFQILENPWIKDIRFIPGIFGHSLSGFSAHSFQQATYRPLMYAAFTVEYLFFGLNPMGWHLVNILVHGANGVLVFLISTRLLSSFGEGGGEAEEGGMAPIAIWLTALTTGVLFVSHPAGSEPLSWVSALPELAFAFLILLAFFLYIAPDKGGKEPGDGRVAIAGFVPGPLLFFLALLFKETAVVLPLLCFGYDLISRRGKGIGAVVNKRALLIYGFYVLAFAAYMVLRILALGHLTPDNSINAYLGGGGLLLNAAAGFYKAACMLFWPFSIYPFQIFKGLASPFEAAAIPALSFTAAFFIALFFLRKRLHSVVLIAILVMVLPVLPALYTPVITRFDFAPRYVYLSTAGYAIFIAFVLRWFFHAGPLGERIKARGLSLLLSWALIIMCAFIGAGKSRDWSDNLTLSRAALRGSEDNYFALYQIGNSEAGRGRHSEAVKSYKEAIGIIERQEHQDLQTLRNALLGLGSAYVSLDRIDEAMGVYETTTRLWPGNAAANYQLAYLYQGRGGCEKALYYYGRAFRNFTRSQDKKDTLLNMGNCYARLTLYSRALESYAEALGLAPGDAIVIQNMEAVRRRMGKP
ncbi:MAG: tetratricopeptide repeat protein [Thermodesulfobacteriota bacterium]